MKKKYIAPSVTWVEFETENMLASSGGNDARVNNFRGAETLNLNFGTEETEWGD